MIDKKLLERANQHLKILEAQMEILEWVLCIIKKCHPEKTNKEK